MMGSEHRRRLGLLFWTVRYLTPAQVWHRIRGTVRRQWWQRRRLRAPQPAHWQFVSRTPLFIGLEAAARPGPWQDDVTRAIAEAHEVAAGRFRFLNQRVDCAQRPAWHDAQLSQLWRFHLHYFHYAQDLLAWSFPAQWDPKLGIHVT